MPLLNILHIDDEDDVLQMVHDVINGETVGGKELFVKDSCGFEVGMKKLQENEYDLIILDLCIGKAAMASDKIGEVIFQQIKKRAFIPVVFFTGLPEYVRHLESNIVRVAAKGEGYDSLFAEIERIIKTGVIDIKNDVNDIIREGLRSYFWDFVQPNGDVIGQIQHDQISLKYLLLRRLGRMLSSEIVRASAEDPLIGKDYSHPMEFYIYPPVDGEYECGDIIKSRATGEISVLLTPSCDFIVRKGGLRNAEKILVAHTTKFKDTFQYKRMLELREKKDRLTKEGKELPKEEAGQLVKLPERLKQMMKPNANERFFFLPQTPFLEAVFIDFQHKSSITYDQLESEFDVIATLDDPIAQAVLSSYSRYFSRVGYQDLDIDFAYSQIDL